MCLYTKQNNPNIAQDDIIVCKVMLVWKDGSIHSPYQQLSTNWELNELYINSQEISTREYWGWIELSKGFYHSYQNELACQDLVNYLNRKIKRTNNSHEVKIYKAIIPKGTEYYIGQRSDFCSRAIIIKDDFT